MEKTFTINLRVNISYVVRFLGGLILACIFVAFLRGFIIYTTGNNNEDGLLMKFNMDLEQTLPTYISTINLLIASGLLALVAKFKRSIGDTFWVHWCVLSLGFLFLSVDESISIHEVIVRSFVMQLFHNSSPAHLGAGIFILLCAAISGLFFLKFILHLP